MLEWNSPDFLGKLMKIETSQEVEALLNSLPVVSPEEYEWEHGSERKGSWESGKLHWLPVGRNRGNSGNIKLAGEPINPIAERLVRRSSPACA